MLNKSKVLQIGLEDWSHFLSNHHQSKLEWHFFNIIDSGKNDYKDKMKEKNFDVVICTDTLDNNIINKFLKLFEPYSLIVDNSFQNELTDKIKELKCPVFMDLKDKNFVLTELSSYFYRGQRGGKLHTNSILLNDSFGGEAMLSGQHRLRIQGKFSVLGEQCPILTWKKNIDVRGCSQKIWLEYKHSKTVEIGMVIVGYTYGREDKVSVWNYTEHEIKQGIEVKYIEGLTDLSVSLIALGEGSLEIGPLHYRNSRNKYGEFLLGGQKVFDDQNEELFYYFHPGDMKPPLNVYFSGYHTLETFEGFYMMKSLGAPFLLIADNRLEGGSFYLGSNTLEKKIINVISKHLKILSFSNSQLILSGLSMGTFGALYYGSKLSPHTVIIGKPLVNLGNIAANEQIIRPGGFPTSLDVLNSLEGTLSDEAIKKLNEKFWNVFDRADFDNTQFIISYMEHDDYDAQAYEDILEHLSVKDTLLIGKGIPGRHNDNFSGIFDWFIKHYQRILTESFCREVKE